LKLGNYSPPALSADSRYVAFNCTASNAIYRHDLRGSATNVLVRAYGRNPTISGDGQLVAYETSLPTPAVAQIAVKNLQTGAQELISDNYFTHSPGNGASTTPQISPDGRFVVFASRASNLVPGDTNGCADIFVRDRVLATTTLVTVNRWGTGPGNGASAGPMLAADGRTVLFQSLASDLIEGDYNDRRDVFTVRLGNGDTDGDGMDDDWEMAYFNTLDRDGSGDFDGDGLSDRSELLAGTDPTKQGSVLRMLTTTVTGGSTTVSWSAVPGRRYQVQFKDGASAPDWNNLGAVTTATTATGLTVDPAGGVGPQRFYRVTLAP
jgi:Tol biopolymer transport system component